MNALKKSILYRLVFAVVIVGMWGYSFLTGHEDKDFYVQFQNEAKTVEGLAELITAAKALEEKDELSAPAALARAASADGKKLHAYVDIYGRNEPSNKAVAQFVFEGSQAKLRKGIDIQGGTEIIVSFDAHSPEHARSAPAPKTHKLFWVYLERLVQLANLNEKNQPRMMRDNSPSR